MDTSEELKQLGKVMEIRLVRIKKNYENLVKMRDNTDWDNLGGHSQSWRVALDKEIEVLEQMYGFNK